MSFNFMTLKMVMVCWSDTVLVAFPIEYCKFHSRISPVIFLKQKGWTSSFLNKMQSILIGILRQNSQDKGILGIVFSSSRFLKDV